MTTENQTLDELLNVVEKSVKDGFLPIPLDEDKKQQLEDICRRLNLNKMGIGSVIIGLANFITKYQEDGWNLYLEKGSKKIKMVSIKEINNINKHKK